MHTSHISRSVGMFLLIVTLFSTCHNASGFTLELREYIYMEITHISTVYRVNTPLHTNTVEQTYLYI